MPKDFVLRRFISLQIDLLIILVATCCALLLRDNFAFSWARLVEVSPYFVATLSASIIIVPLSGLSQTFWRFSSMPDYVRIVWVVAAIVLLTVLLTFATNRLDGVARSLPILQFFVAASLMVGSRVILRLRHVARERRLPAIAPLTVVDEPNSKTVLVVGLSRLTETYLQSIDELAKGRIKVAGLVGQRDRHVGRLVGQYKVLGLSEQIDQIVADLEVHGVMIDKIVVTTAFESLNANAQSALLNMEQAGSIELQFLSEQLGFIDGPQKPSSAIAAKKSQSDSQVSFEIPAKDLNAIARRKYWRIKRYIDVVAASFLIIGLAPIIALVGIAVAINIGLPVAFWQQRPGLGGRPFRLLKLRSMSPARSPEGYRRSDEARTSRFGNFLRKTRLDELPQLFNILKGDMSFIGPRPLLPRDQSKAHRARLFVRPGLTGWAQVVGGREVSAEDKAALDVWYVQNASLSLDLKIVLRTIPMVIFGETTCSNTISSAWQDLGRSGVLRTNNIAFLQRQNPALAQHQPGPSRLWA